MEHSKNYLSIIKYNFSWLIKLALLFLTNFEYLARKHTQQTVFYTSISDLNLKCCKYSQCAWNKVIHFSVIMSNFVSTVSKRNNWREANKTIILMQGHLALQTKPKERGKSWSGQRGTQGERKTLPRFWGIRNNPKPIFNCLLHFHQFPHGSLLLAFEF